MEMLGEEMRLQPELYSLLRIVAESSAFAIGEEKGLHEVVRRQRKYIRISRREKVE